jgi:GNAT superfamily N-acetyltransferase
MHLVESEIESERRPGAAPQPLESHVAFARNLPSQFDDHTWLAETHDETPVGCSACWSDAVGDPRVMECYVYVRQHWRAQGVGWRLARAILDEAEREGRSSLVWATFDAVGVAELDRALVGAERQRWTIFVRDADACCVGGTELTFEPWDPGVALQQNTAIHPTHRGLGLAKWAKASMLARLRDHRPTVDRIRTANAFSNQPMLVISDALGFKVVDVRTEWQGNTRHLRRSIH